MSSIKESIARTHAQQFGRDNVSDKLKNYLPSERRASREELQSSPAGRRHSPDTWGAPDPRSRATGHQSTANIENPSPVKRQVEPDYVDRVARTIAEAKNFVEIAPKTQNKETFRGLGSGDADNLTRREQNRASSKTSRGSNEPDWASKMPGPYESPRERGAAGLDNLSLAGLGPGDVDNLARREQNRDVGADPTRMKWVQEALRVLNRDIDPVGTTDRPWSPQEVYDTARSIQPTQSIEGRIGSREQFMAEVAPVIASYAQQNGILPSVAIAQTILESDWGQHTAGPGNHNLFGVKYTGATPHGSMHRATHDGMGGGYGADFAYYPTYEDSIKDYASRVMQLGYYDDVRAAPDSASAVNALHRSPYAADNRYGPKLTNIITENNLERFDNQLYSINNLGSVDRSYRPPDPRDQWAKELYYLQGIMQ